MVSGRAQRTGSAPWTWSLPIRPLKWDPCVYIYEDETNFVIQTLYVDGILFLSASKTLLNKPKKQLVDWF